MSNVSLMKHSTFSKRAATRSFFPVDAAFPRSSCRPKARDAVDDGRAVPVCELRREARGARRPERRARVGLIAARPFEQVSRARGHAMAEANTACRKVALFGPRLTAIRPASTAPEGMRPARVPCFSRRGQRPASLRRRAGRSARHARARPHPFSSAPRGMRSGFRGRAPSRRSSWRKIPSSLR